MAEIVLPASFSAEVIFDVGGNFYVRFPGGQEGIGVGDGPVRIRTGIEFDPSAIPEGSSIDEIHFGYDPQSTNLSENAHLGLYSGADLQTDGDQETYDGCDVSGIPYVTSGFLNATGLQELDITTAGSRAALQAALGTTKFALGIRVADEASAPTRLAAIGGYNFVVEESRPTLRVVYSEGAATAIRDLIGGGVIPFPR